MADGKLREDVTGQCRRLNGMSGLLEDGNLNQLLNTDNVFLRWYKLVMQLGELSCNGGIIERS